MEGNDIYNSFCSNVIVSNDNFSRIIKVGKNTNIGDFYEQIMNQFQISDDLEMKFFYFEGYSKEKHYIINEQDYVIANKKGIEYLYFCSKNNLLNENNDFYDFLKYYSVLIFSPLIKLNNENQKKERKKMQLLKYNENNNTINNNNNNNLINNNDNSNLMNNFMMNYNITGGNITMNNPMMMINTMNNNIMMNNPIMKNNNMINTMNNNMINKMNNNMINTMKNNMMMNCNNMMNSNNLMNNNIMMKNMMNNPILFNTFMNQLYNIFQTNPLMFFSIIKNMDPKILNNFIEKKSEENNLNNKIKQNSNDLEIMPEYETISLETDPLNIYLENAINISYNIKKDICMRKQIAPNKFFNISQVLSNPGFLQTEQPSKNDYKYILCLIGKILENHGISVGIYKNNKRKDRIDLLSIQFLFNGLINKKKYVLTLNLNKNEIISIKHDLSYRKKFLKKIKLNIGFQLKIQTKFLIVTNPRGEENLLIDLAFNPKVEILDQNRLMKKLIKGTIIGCQIMPLIEGCRLSPNIFDQKFNKFYGLNSNQNINLLNNNMLPNFNNNVKYRGGEQYISPISWTAYGIDVSGKYDFGDNTWLGNSNQFGEFAVAYYGINNLFNNNMNIIQNLFSLMGNLESGRTFIDSNNIRNPGHKCQVGAYFYKNPNYAENSSEEINIGGFKYKIMFMCRVNPVKIRQPETFPDLWILSPSPDEVRPYKILIKKIPISPLAIASLQNIKISFNSPSQKYLTILSQKDESYFNLNNTLYSNYDFVLSSYTNSSNINDYLRDNIINGPENMLKSYVWCLHKAITRSPQNVPNNYLVYRGVKFKLPLNINVGTKFYFPHFLSTSKDISVAQGFAFGGSLMNISILNNGVNGKKVYCRDIENISFFPWEKEIIITAYCQFRVTKIIRANPFQNFDIVFLTCEGYNFNDD